MKNYKTLGSREIIASSLGSDIREAEFKVDIHNLRESMIELSVTQLDEVKYKKIVSNLIYKGIVNEHGGEFIKFYQIILFRIINCSKIFT